MKSAPFKPQPLRHPLRSNRTWSRPVESASYWQSADLFVPAL